MRLTDWVGDLFLLFLFFFLYTFTDMGIVLCLDVCHGIVLLKLLIQTSL